MTAVLRLRNNSWHRVSEQDRTFLGQVGTSQFNQTDPSFKWVLPKRRAATMVGFLLGPPFSQSSSPMQPTNTIVRETPVTHLHMCKTRCFRPRVSSPEPRGSPRRHLQRGFQRLGLVPRGFVPGLGRAWPRGLAPHGLFPHRKGSIGSDPQTKRKPQSLPVASIP